MNTNLVNKLKDYEVTPSQGVWANIESKYSQNSVKNTSKSKGWIIGAASALLLTAIVWYFVSTERSQIVNIDNNKNQIGETTPATDLTIITTDNSKDDSLIKVEANQFTYKNELDNSEKFDGKNTETVIIPEIQTSTKIGVEKPEILLLTEKELKRPDVKVITPIPLVTATTIESSNIAEMEIAFAPNPTVCFGEDAILFVEEGYKYNWNTGDNRAKIKVCPVEDQTYYVTVTMPSGKSIVHNFDVKIDRNCTALFVPSAFSPNGDGKNDYFKIEGSSISALQLQIFNQLGKIVFETNSIDGQWNGEIFNGPAPEGTYFYQAKYVDGLAQEHIKRGQIIIIR